MTDSKVIFPPLIQITMPSRVTDLHLDIVPSLSSVYCMYCQVDLPICLKFDSKHVALFSNHVYYDDFTYLYSCYQVGFIPFPAKLSQLNMHPLELYLMVRITHIYPI